MKSVVLIPDKSYSFVVFIHVEDSTKALQAVHGKIGLSDKGPLYVAYVPQPPSYHDPWGDHSLRCPVPGLQIIPDFISCEEEEELAALFEWRTAGDSCLKNRQVQHFGFEFNYKTYNIDPSKPLLEAPIPTQCIKVGYETM